MAYHTAWICWGSPPCLSRLEAALLPGKWCTRGSWPTCRSRAGSFYPTFLDKNTRKAATVAISERLRTRSTHCSILPKEHKANHWQKRTTNTQHSLTIGLKVNHALLSDLEACGFKGIGQHFWKYANLLSGTEWDEKNDTTLISLLYEITARV